MVLKFWKIVNVKDFTAGKRFRDDRRDPIKTVDHQNLQFLLHFADICDFMYPKDFHRQMALTSDTSKALSQTCRGLVHLSRFLLTVNDSFRHEFILLGSFQSDDLESHFGHFRQSAGGNYYISAMQIWETHKIDLAKLALQLDSLNEELSSSNPRHLCMQCSRNMSETEFDTIDILPELVPQLSQDEIGSLFHIAGYLCRNDITIQGEQPEYNGDFTIFLDRGGLNYPCSEFLTFVIFGFTFFKVHKNNQFCRNRVILAFNIILDGYFNLCLKHSTLLSFANILLNNFSKISTPRSSEKAMKIAKLQ